MQSVTNRNELRFSNCYGRGAKVTETVTNHPSPTPLYRGGMYLLRCYAGPIVTHFFKIRIF